MDWSDNWRDAFRIELRAEAQGLAWHGWSVLPGTYPDENGVWTDGVSAVAGGSPVPVHADWQLGLAAGPASPDQVAKWWTGRPYTVLAATGRVLNAVEVPATVGMRTARLLRTVGVVAPIVGTPAGTWMFLTEAGSYRRSVLAGHPEVTLHGEGNYIPLPPSPYQHGVVHWRVKPQTAGWHLAGAELVQDAVARVLDGTPLDVEDRLLATQRLSA